MTVKKNSLFVDGNWIELQRELIALSQEVCDINPNFTAVDQKPVQNLEKQSMGIKWCLSYKN